MVVIALIFITEHLMVQNDNETDKYILYQIENIEEANSEGKVIRKVSLQNQNDQKENLLSDKNVSGTSTYLFLQNGFLFFLQRHSDRNRSQLKEK